MVSYTASPVKVHHSWSLDKVKKHVLFFFFFGQCFIRPLLGQCDSKQKSNILLHNFTWVCFNTSNQPPFVVSNVLQKWVRCISLQTRITVCWNTRDIPGGNLVIIVFLVLWKTMKTSPKRSRKARPDRKKHPNGNNFNNVNMFSKNNYKLKKWRGKTSHGLLALFAHLHTWFGD